MSETATEVERWQQKWKRRGLVIERLREQLAETKSERDQYRRESAEHLALLDGKTALALVERSGD